MYLCIFPGLYITAKDWEYSKYPSIKISIYTLEYYAPQKNNEETLHADIKRSQEYITERGKKQDVEQYTWFATFCEREREEYIFIFVYIYIKKF